ncbi:MAG TPA: hypothetical protein VGI73_03685 [Solirubrobacterales bacterium]|jgi:hypothetical protein
MSTALHVVGWITSLVPRPVGLPETIGLDFPLSMAGAGGVIGGLIRLGATAVQRDRFARRWGNRFVVNERKLTAVAAAITFALMLVFETATALLMLACLCIGGTLMAISERRRRRR